MNALHDALHPELLAFAIGWGATREDAEDILQQVWAAFAKTSETQTVAAPRAWLYRALRNRLTDRYRRRATQPLIVPLENRFGGSRTDDPGDGRRQGTSPVDRIAAIPADTAPPAAILDAAEFWSRVEAALAELPPAQAETFRRNVLDGETLLDIARHQGVPVRTAISRKRYARERLRDLLGDLYEDYFADE